MAYLYGASIQGIQGFIFETNKLKEIVGASNLIERFCSLGFLARYCNKYNIDITKENILRMAGGNIRIMFEHEKDVKNMVRNFSKYIMLEAYGITISQAVVEYEKNKYLEASKNLEVSLKNARNRVPLVLDAKFAFMKQAPRTGKPAFEKKNAYGNSDVLFDQGSFQKYNNAEPAHENMLLEKIGITEDKYNYFPLELSQISNTKNKIAVIHADGNKMGLLLQKMAEKLKNQEDEKIQKVYKEFSVGIETATKDAINDAFDEYFKLDDYSKERQVPFRPIIIGGDDVTVICHADKAIDFISLYMKKFQENTKKELFDIVDKYDLDKFKEGLTACAGIAYCNEKFPFHYAVTLAEVLCGRAKEASGREYSCLLFHNVQGAAFVDYKQYVQNELIVDNGTTATHLQYGPYYIRKEDNKKPYLGDLQSVYDAMAKESFPIGKLREWLSELHYSSDYAKSYLERVKVMAERNSQKDTNSLNKALKDLDELSLDKLIDDNHKTPMHDILQLKSVQGGK